jgi:taurine transport system substrate-binding protein
MNKNLFKNIFHIFYSNLIILIILTLSTLSSQAKTINVAYFLEWPTPNQEAKVNKTYDKEMNAKLRWKNFTNGGAMIDAMLAGDIDIAYSTGIVPFINAVKSNAPIKMVGISVIYGMGGTTCIVSNSSGISKNNAKKLEGKKVAVPLGTMAEYVFDEFMISLGVDRKKIKVVQMDPQDGAEALKKGKVDGACVFGGKSIRKALKYGKRLLTVTEAREAGIAGVDVILVTDRFLNKNRELVEKFIEVTDAANENYKKGKSNLKIIAKDAAMKVSDAKTTMSGFYFLSSAEQQFYLSKNGMTRNFLRKMGVNDIDKVVDISFLRAASKNIQMAKKKPKKEEKKIKIKKETVTEKATTEEYTSTASSSDTKPPIIVIDNELSFSKPKYFLTGKIKDDSTVFLEVDGFLIPVEKGTFKIARYSPVDENVLIKATDQWGNESTKTIKVKIDINRTVTVKKLEPLNPLKIKGKNKDNKIALIIGIEKYLDTVSADFANLDAKYFNEYAREVFNVKSENINLLTDSEATLTKINKSLFKWLAGKIKSDQTEVIIFFAGHGLASNNGKELYFLPQDGDPDLLSRTAISRSDLLQEIVSLKPRSVTMFLDMCYSGVSRNEETLLASARPVRIIAGEQGEIPSNFTIFSASQLDQVSSGIKEAKHGIFSYYVMKGLEGNADLNKDKEITNGELLAYINDKVSSKALEQGRKQNPEMLGEKNKILIKY